MAVIMSYHKLVERDSKKIEPYWKSIIVTLLVFGTISCFITSFSLQSLINSYNSRCILYSEMKFVKRIEERKAPDQNLTKEYPSNQQSFMDNYDVSSLNSNWGSDKSCQFGVYLPIFEAFFAVIMTTMFMICGHGGKSEPHDFLPQPWRIVMPSLIYFTLMSGVSIAHLVMVTNGMKTICESFANVLPDVGCDEAIQYFILNKNDSALFPPALLYKLLVVFVWIILTAWVSAFITLLIRVIFVVDFQLVKVTIRSQDSERIMSSTVFKTEDDRDAGSPIEDDNPSSSKSSYKSADDELEEPSEQTITEQIDDIMELVSNKIAMRDKKLD